VVPLILFFILSWQKSYTGDEGLTVYLAQGSFTHLLNNVGTDYHMPGYYVCLWTISHLVGNSLLVLRLFSLLIILAMLVLSLRFLTFPASLFLAVSPFTLHLAIEVRMYGLLALCSLLVVLAWRKYQRFESWKSLLMLILTLSLCTWVHYFGWICTFAVSILLLRKRHWKRFASVIIAVAVLFLPWAGNVISKIDNTVNVESAQTIEFPDQPGLTQRLTGMPLSIAGTFLKFSGGLAAFDFGTWNIGSVTAFSIAGFLLGSILLIFAIRGFKSSDGIVKSIILCTFLGLAFFRPTARHYSVAFPAFMMLVSSGLPKSTSGKTTAVAVVTTLMLILCIPYTQRSTIPQRCTWNRNFLQVARIAAEESREASLPLVLYLDTYSLLGITMHLDESGFQDSLIWHPHLSSFDRGICFYDSRWDCVRYLQHSTDSLVSQWLELTGDNRGFILVANIPGYAEGLVFGVEPNQFTGLGSDIMADIDLLDVMQERLRFEQILLTESEGPLSVFVCSGPAD